MALRLDSAVIRGEIDNTTRGNVRGKLWLVGREEPVVLDLRGDAWRDVAGARLTFINPTPEAQSVAAEIQPRQTGYVGDITASQKIKAESEFEDDTDSQPAAEWHNALYFEWFSNENGRVFIESTSFEVSMSEWIWEMDEADEEAQKMTNLHTMRGWLAGIIQRPEPKEDDEAEDDFDDSEESWEESLKQSDRLSDAHLEALEKYGMDGLDDDRVFFVMGWDHMLGRGGPPSNADDDDDDEEEDDDGEAWKQADGETAPEAFDEEDFDRWLEEEEKREQHPLQKRAHDLVLRLMTDIDEEREENTQTSDGSTALDRFIRNSMNISGKLAGALGYGEMSGSRDRGYTLAILRRCLNWANEALAALNELSESPAWQARLELLGEFRAELFALRDGITDLRKELREH
ncbi:MAG: hypothetical protein IAE77_21670 [Prosthecobacter sp.]|uniref:hypothetical protein n=1 Tax=Prosthecobacter sp. TaxID=1965333 RepID=UPI0019EC26E7|nr:hypothetical protein [Prosthecobacter sp.]MBE2286079.1 hypothetical protein [Prosthecobacter sp.]